MFGLEDTVRNKIGIVFGPTELKGDRCYTASYTANYVIKIVTKTSKETSDAMRLLNRWFYLV